MRSFQAAFFLFTFMQVTHAVQAESFRLSIEIGSASTDTNANNIINKYPQLTPSSSLSTDMSTLMMSFGYVLDEYLSIGSDLLISGSVTATESGYSYKLFSTDTLSVYAKAGAAISTRVSLYGKLGLHIWSLSESLDSPGGLDNGVDLTYGVSTNIDLYGGSTRQLQIQWNHYDYNGVHVNSQDVISAGILFLF